MNSLIKSTTFSLSVATVVMFASVVCAQEPVSAPIQSAVTTQIPPAMPVPQGRDPVPQDAESGLISAFDHYEVVAMPAAHGAKDLDDLILHLVRNPVFANKVNDIVVECGNSLYQTTLDRYIAGENVSLDEVRPVWRNTTQSMCGLSAFYVELFPLIRRINQSLPPDQKLRVLAGDPPIDWSKVITSADLWEGRFLERDPSIAAIMEKEVLAKHRKALMLFGTFHLFHVSNGPVPTAVEIYEKTYPNVTLVVDYHMGFGNWSPSDIYNNQFETKLASWPRPSLAINLKDTWLADLIDQTKPTNSGFFIPPGMDPEKAKATIASMKAKASLKYADRVDAYLYLGPRDHLLKEPMPAAVIHDQAYMTEIKRRESLVGFGSADQFDPNVILKGEANSFFYGSD